jgi:hypothetical protein
LYDTNSRAVREFTFTFITFTWSIKMVKTRIKLSVAAFDKDIANDIATLRAKRAAIRARKVSITKIANIVNRIVARASMFTIDPTAIHGWSSAYAYSSRNTVDVSATIRITVDALNGRAFKYIRTALLREGFTETKAPETFAGEWAAGLRAGYRLATDGADIYEISLGEDLRDGTEGATCRKVQVGTKTEVVETPVFAVVCD